jgi:hypothetical protein
MVLGEKKATLVPLPKYALHQDASRLHVCSPKPRRILGAHQRRGLHGGT